MADPALAALRRVNLDWTVMLKGVWQDVPGDVPSIHQDLRADFLSAIDALAASAVTSSPTGWVIVGDGGTGKTHLLGRFRGESTRRKGCFVLVDMTDVRDFWDTVLLGYFTSLQELGVGRRPQYERLVSGVLGLLQFAEPTAAIVNRLRGLNPAKLRPAMDKVLGTLHRIRPAEVNLNGDVIRALVALNSADFSTANVGSAWLQGEEIDADIKKKLGMTRAREKPSNIVRGMSWLMSLCGPSVVALDQLDPIVTQLNLEHAATESPPAMSIINKIGAGLSELRDVTRRTLLVVSCVDRTWKSLKEFTPRQFTDRYHPPRILGPLNSRESVSALLVGRLQPFFAEAGFVPPYPTWPFTEAFLQQVALDSPREVLKTCQAHINECIRRGAVRELPPGWGTSIALSDTRFGYLDAKFAELQSTIDDSPLLDEQHEDDGLGELIRSALRCVLKEVALPGEIDPVIDESFTGAKSAKPLHARLRLVFPKEQSREEHFCFRAIQKTNAVAFTSRLRSAVTQSGIEKSLKFRRLLILRKASPPGGAGTAAMIRQFDELGGVWLDPAPQDLAALEALRLMEKEANPDFVDWLKARRHASNTSLIRLAIPEYFAYAQPPKSAPPSPPAAPPTKPPPLPATITLGRRLTGDIPAPLPTVLPVAALRNHGFAFAGAGSGRTVLLKRLVEEAALHGIPSIVIDSSNELATIGQRWQAPPPQWSVNDAKLAEALATTVETVIWTPGIEAGNPLTFDPLPDLAPLASSPEGLNDAVAMAIDALTPLVALGPRAAEAKKRAILQSALVFLARQDNRSIERLEAILRELPAAAATKLPGEQKLAQDMAESLCAARAATPLLASDGPASDIRTLLESPDQKTRVSIVSLTGLATPTEQRQFLSRLAINLFAWSRTSPAPAHLPLRAMLVIDEARDFVPASGSSSSLPILQRLTSPGRQDGLGIIFAAPNPRDIEPKIVGQCATHWYGMMNSPAAIDAAAELLNSRGGSPADDVSMLKPGDFYVSNAEHIQPPARLRAPMCLSANAEALSHEEVVLKARECREISGHTPASAVAT